MGAGDAVLAALFIGGALWLLYRSFVSKKCGCHGCDKGCGASCGPVPPGAPGGKSNG